MSHVLPFVHYKHEIFRMVSDKHRFILQKSAEKRLAHQMNTNTNTHGGRR